MGKAITKDWLLLKYGSTGAIVFAFIRWAADQAPGLSMDEVNAMYAVYLDSEFRRDLEDKSIDDALRYKMAKSTVDGWMPK